MQNTIKRLLCLALTVMMVLSLVPAAVFAADTAVDAVAVNTTTGAQYDNLTDALFEAADGQTVQLKKDVEDTITTVFENVTLDLNGNTLTTQYMTCFGDLVDTSADNAGLLQVADSRFMLQESNSQLPVKTAEGYCFAQLDGFNVAMPNASKYVFQPKFEAASHEALAQGSEATGVSVEVFVTWKQGDGIRAQRFAFNDSHLQGFLASYKPATGKFGRQFALTLMGAENFEELSFSARIVSTTGVIFDADPSQMKPEGSVDVNENGELVGDMTLESAHGTAFVPAGTKLAEGTKVLKLTTTPMASSGSGLELDESQEMTSLDVHIEGIAAGNTVPVIVTLNKVAPEFLNQGNLALYHVENGQTVEMTRVFSAEEVDAHNEYYYDIATGALTMAMASFSEVAVVSKAAVWEGGVDYSWYNAEKDSFEIYNADQLNGFAKIVGGMQSGSFVDADRTTFAGKTVTLMADINLGDKDNASSNHFEPIGYHYIADQDGDPATTDPYSSVSSFEGIFDGNGHTIANFYQNTWEIPGDYSGNYYNDAMGLFGYVVDATIKNLTVDSFSSDGEFTPTGCVAAYAENSDFINIAITNCNPRVYNTGNGGVIGIAGRSDDKKGEHILLQNVSVDKTNKITALWGSWDVACGGLVGMFRGNDTSAGLNGSILFDNCHVSAEIDVYNDVCANYQYYQYRYAGMLIGSVRHNTKNDVGRVVPVTDGIKAENTQVYIGDWKHDYYCELVANTTASYTHDYQFSRLTLVDSIDTENMTVTVGGKTTAIPTSGRYHYVVVNGEHCTENATCYHFVNGAAWNHDTPGKQLVDVDGDGVKDDVMIENNRHIYLPFPNQLFTGYGWGVSHVAMGNLDGVTWLNDDASYTKFTGIADETYQVGETVTIGSLFKAVTTLPNDLTINTGNVQVFVSPADESSKASGTYVANTDDWTQGQLTFTGAGAATITITDYDMCIATTITVNVAGFKAEPGMYELVTDINEIKTGGQYVVVAELNGVSYALNNSEADSSSIAGAIVNVFGDIVANKNVAFEWTVAPSGEGITLKNGKNYLVYTGSSVNLQLDTTSYAWQIVEADGAFNLINANGDRAIAYRNEYDFRCYGVNNEGSTGYTFDLYFYKLITCEHECDEEQRVVVNATCTEKGSVTYTCTKCNEKIVEVIEATGHTYTETVTKPTCTEDGYTTYTCSCGDTYTGDTVPATGHKDDNTDNTCDVCGEQIDEVYNVTFIDRGETTTQRVIGENVVLPTPENIPDGFAFVGWATATVDKTTNKPTVYNETCTTNSDLTLYAVYSSTEEGTGDGSYVKVTEDLTDWSGDYLIVYVNDKVAFNGGLTKLDAASNTISVTITDGEIVADTNTNAAKFTIATIEGGYSVKSAGGQYIGQDTNDNGLDSTDSAVKNTISWNEDGTIDIISAGGAYLRYNATSGQNRFRYYKSSTYDSQKAIHLYKLVNSTTYYMTTLPDPECVHTNKTTATVNPTCTVAGSVTVTCDDCGATVSTETIAALGHSYNSVVDPKPTCTEAGVETFTCANCDDSYTEEVAATGHVNTTTTTVNATCSTAGSITVTCACGETIRTETIAAKGHNYIDGTCSNCGETEPTEFFTISFSVPSNVAAVPDQLSNVALPAAADFEVNGKQYTFVGWTTAAIKEEENVTSAPAFFEANSVLDDLGEEINLIALYTMSTGSAEPGWTATDITDIKASDVVVIVGVRSGNSNYAMTNDKGTGSAPAATKVTVNGNQLSGTIADNIKWNIEATDDGYIIYPNGSTSTWLYCTSTNNGVRVGKNDNKVFTMDASGYLKHTATSRYLGIYNSQDWRCYTNTTGNTKDQTFAFYVYNAGTTTVYLTEPACKHEDATVVEVKATCTEDGSKTTTCSCGYQEEEVLKATGHQWNNGEVTTEATCITDGVKTYTCTVENCGGEKTEIIKATGEHEYDADGKCTTEGCTAEKPSTPTAVTEIYAFSTFSGSSIQNATEHHDLTANMGLDITGSHINTQLRIYNNGVAILTPKSDLSFSALTINAGYKVATLNVYGSNDDGATWTLIQAISTKTSYTDYTVNFNGNTYDSIKLVASGAQIRISKLTWTIGADVATSNAQETALLPEE